jgi:hypothetical protein
MWFSALRPAFEEATAEGRSVYAKVARGLLILDSFLK